MTLNTGDIVQVPHHINSTWAGKAEVLSTDLSAGNVRLAYVKMLDGEMAGWKGHFVSFSLPLVRRTDTLMADFRKALDALRDAGYTVGPVEVTPPPTPSETVVL